MSRGRPRPTAIGVVVMVALAVAAGVWAAGTGGAATAPAAGVVQVDGLPEPVTDRDAVLQWAEQTLAAMCMVEAGFPFWVYWRPDPGDGGDGAADARYGLDDPATAAREGFGIDRALRSPPPVRTNRNRDYAESLSPGRQAAYHEAFHGDPSERMVIGLPSGMTAAVATGGCLARARTDLYGDLAEWLRLDTSWTNLDAEVDGAVHATLVFRNVLRLWSECLEEEGWSAATPADLRDQITKLHREHPRDLAWPQERAAALAEARCALATGLVETGERLHAEIRSEAVAERSDGRGSWEQMLAAAHERALQLLDTTAPSPPPEVGGTGSD